MTDSSRRAPARRLPAADKPIPVSTYRLQLSADFTLDDAAARVGYLADLGVSHLYLSPILQAAAGSTHGYDVVDHSCISAELGGRPALERLAAAARARGLRMILDLVPNHMAVPTPIWHNRALWSVLALGADSPFAHWFDVDWSGGKGALLMPILGERIGQALAAGAFTVDHATPPGATQPEAVLRYHERVFPLAAGTENLPMAELLERQHYRLAWWKVADEELNYRRFFDIDTLVAIRVENPEVFDATHSLILDLLECGLIDGLRIDHPDGLAHPGAYLERLAERSGNAWVAVEKILSPEEALADDWYTVGTTGYDTLWRLQTSFIDAAGAAELGALMIALTGDQPHDLPQLVRQAKHEVIAGSLYTEVCRLTDLASGICDDDIYLRDHTWRGLFDCLTQLLVAADRYRYYTIARKNDPSAMSGAMLPATAAAFAECVQQASNHLSEDRQSTLAVLSDLLTGVEAGSAGRTGERPRRELMVRFQQTMGAVMAKGVEDTAFYRWTHLTGLCEVGGAPERFAISSEELHAWAAETQRHAPLTMTCLSTHDTKRSEDVRARLGVLSEAAPDWAQLVAGLRSVMAGARPASLDGRTENLLWQTLAGTWSEQGPIATERLQDYLVKAAREAKTSTSWTSPDVAFEDDLRQFVAALCSQPELAEQFDQWVERTADGVRAATLGCKLVQLLLPGVADVYQGSESVFLALVDPDNRRPVDFEALAERLARLDAEPSSACTLDDEKLLVTSRALRVRRDHADACVGPEASYDALPCSSGHAFAFARGVAGDPRVVVIATRLAMTLARLGGWQEHSVSLPAGDWQEVFSGRRYAAGRLPLADLLTAFPVALLVRQDL